MCTGVEPGGRLSFTTVIRSVIINRSNSAEQCNSLTPNFGNYNIRMQCFSTNPPVRWKTLVKLLQDFEKSF